MHMNNSLKAISLFSGAGGMDIGIKQAGFSILASIESDPYCCETLRTNIKRYGEKTQVIESDIREINLNSMMNQLGISPGNLDLLFGGPPCQAFSQIGKQKGLDDERGLLLFQMIRFANRLNPKAILIEQVRGLLSAKDKMAQKSGIFKQLLKALEALDYVPKWQLINAADYGVPQLRQRVFIIAIKNSTQFQFPEPTYCQHEQQTSFLSLPGYRKVGEVIKGLGSPSPKGEKRQNSHIDVTPFGDRNRIKGVPEGAYLAAQTHLPKEQRGQLTQKDTTKFLRLSRDKPANTLRGGEIFFHPIEDRYLTPREYMRIQGFPDNYILKGPIRGRSGKVRFLDQHRQVANSVPPPIAKILAQEIKTILCQDYLKFSVIP
jgi:DNA (cytosine-5)-methyltransferase 1